MKSIAKPKPSLAQKVIADLRDKMQSGELSPGDKLPTEQRLSAEHGVSRTVIREAISGLKADGLLVSRQGSGVFVLEPSKAVKTLAFLSENPQTISSVIEALELRAAVESGSAALAAMRCSPAQEADIYSSFNAFKKKVRAGENSEKEDFAFHVAIAEATNNKKFVEFLTLQGRNTIPRSQLRTEANLPLDNDVEERILDEHKAIMEAVVKHDVESARLAMHAHLTKGSERYRALARIVQDD